MALCCAVTRNKPPAAVIINGIAVSDMVANQYQGLETSDAHALRKLALPNSEYKLDLDYFFTNNGKFSEKDLKAIKKLSGSLSKKKAKEREDAEAERNRKFGDPQGKPASRKSIKSKVTPNKKIEMEFEETDGATMTNVSTMTVEGDT